MSFRLLLSVVGVVLLLLCLVPTSTPCDEDCSPDAPACQCICACYAKDMAVSARNDLPAANVVQYALHSEASEYFILLSTDIFRPPIV